MLPRLPGCAAGAARVRRDRPSPLTSPCPPPAPAAASWAPDAPDPGGAPPGVSESAPGGAAGVDVCQMPCCRRVGGPQTEPGVGSHSGSRPRGRVFPPRCVCSVGAGAWDLLVGVDHALQHGFCGEGRKRVGLGGGVPSTLGNLEPGHGVRWLHCPGGSRVEGTCVGACRASPSPPCWAAAEFTDNTQ